MSRSFDHEEFLAAVRRFSPYVDFDGPIGFHTLDREGRVGVRCAAALYIWVSVGVCMYVGQVRRSTNGLEERFTRHHRNLRDYDGVWLIPMRSDVPPEILDRYELGLIRRHDPGHNHVGRQLA